MVLNQLNLKCVHCLQEESEVTWDHLLPKSWYGKKEWSFEKWKFPSCLKCNAELGKVEERLLTAFGMALDSTDPFNQEIIQRVLRSMKSDAGDSSKDSKARSKKRIQFLAKDLVQVDAQVKQVLMPNFDQVGGPVDGAYAVRINFSDMRAFGRKVIKGFEWITDRRYVADKDIQVRDLTNEAGAEFISLIDQYGTYTSCGKSIRVGRAICSDNTNCRLYYFEVWGRFKMYGIVGCN